MKSDEVKKIYYDLLLKYKKKYGIQIYAYNFMSNHPHITGKMDSKEAFSNYFRVVNNLFAKKYNRIHGRRGQVVMDRFKKAENLKKMKNILARNCLKLRAKSATAGFREKMRATFLEACR